jgi:uncharacterized protein YndB with AHSA1/START domain
MPTFSIQIAAPPEMVFDELSHVERHPSWANPKANMQMEQTAGDGPGPASHYVSHATFVGKPVSADIDVTRYEPPRVYALKATQHQEGKKDSWIEHTFTLTPVDGGTKLTKHMIGEVSLGGIILGFLAYPAIKRDAMTSLGNLKRMMEAKASGGVPSEG